MALAALSTSRRKMTQADDDDDAYTFSDDQRQAYFDLQFLSGAKREKPTSSSSVNDPSISINVSDLPGKKTLRHRQQFSADSAASNNRLNNSANTAVTSRSSSFPPLFGSMFSSNNSSSASAATVTAAGSSSSSVTGALSRPAANSNNASSSFSTRDVRSGLVASPEDSGPSFAEFYDVDYGMSYEDEDMSDEEYLEDYYGERSHFNLQERLREVNNAFQADSTPVERVTSKSRRVKFNEEVSVFCPSIDGDDDENQEGLYTTKELEPSSSAGSSSNNSDKSVTSRRASNQPCARGSMDDGLAGHASNDDSQGCRSDASSSKNRAEEDPSSRGGGVLDDLVIRDLEAEIFPPHCELGEGEYSHALRNGTALTNPHDQQQHQSVYSSDAEFSSLGSNLSENCNQQETVPAAIAASLSNTSTKEAPTISSTQINEDSNKIVIDLTLKPEEPAGGDITANPFFSKPIPAEDLQNKLSELCAATADPNIQEEERLLENPKDPHPQQITSLNTSHINGSLKDYDGFSMDEEDRALAALTSKPIITEIMEKAGNLIGPHSSHITGSSSSKKTHEAESESGSMNDSSDSLVIPNDTGSDTSSDITAVLQNDVADGADEGDKRSADGVVGDDKGATGGQEDGTKPAAATVQKRQRPTSARIRPRSITSASSTVTKHATVAEEAHDEKVEENKKSVKFPPDVTSDTSPEPADEKQPMPSVTSPAKIRRSPATTRKNPTANNQTSSTKSPVQESEPSPGLPAPLRRPKSAVTLTNKRHAISNNSQLRSSSSSSARPVTAESIQHLRCDANHPLVGSDAGDSSGQQMSPKRGRQPLAWQYAKLPTYDGAKSPYGLSAKQLEERERLKEELAEKRRKEKEDKIQAELDKRKQREINFQLWLQRKKEERSSDSGMSSEGSSASAGGRPARPGSVSPVKSKRLPMRAKDVAAAEESFKAWMERKKEEEKIERRRAELRMLSSPTNSGLHSKEDCDLAFQQWVRRKNAERRAEEARRGHVYRSMSLDRLLKHAKTLKSAYMAYFGPDF